jgi:hypothetical protein
MKHSSDLELVPLILRVVGVQTVSTHTGLCGDEDALPTVVELSNDGLLLSRGTKVTEVHSETTDDS